MCPKSDTASTVKDPLPFEKWTFRSGQSVRDDKGIEVIRLKKPVMDSYHSSGYK
jgi:hypothetical protein